VDYSFIMDSLGVSKKLFQIKYQRNFKLNKNINGNTLATDDK